MVVAPLSRARFPVSKLVRQVFHSVLLVSVNEELSEQHGCRQIARHPRAVLVVLIRAPHDDDERLGPVRVARIVGVGPRRNVRQRAVGPLHLQVVIHVLGEDGETFEVEECRVADEVGIGAVATTLVALRSRGGDRHQIARQSPQLKRTKAKQSRGEHTAQSTRAHR